MPDVRNCRRCGRMYNYLGGPPICIDCKNADEEVFKKIKAYLYDYPGATLSQVALDCDVSVEKIKMFLREGRLEITDGANIILECEKCGKSIKTGRFCTECQSQLHHDISGTVGKSEKEDKEVKKPGVGMRYLNKNF